MITTYPVDKKRVWTGVAVSQSEKAPLQGYTDPPPALTGTEVAMRMGKGWKILPHYPVSPQPSKPIPQVVTMRQARLALLGAGLLNQVETALNSLEEPQRSAALIEWEYAQEVKRDYPWVTQMVAVMGLTDEQVDDLFMAAAVL